MSSSTVISHEDVVKQVYRFLEASGYKSTLMALQAESAIPYNVINEVDAGHRLAPKEGKSVPRTAEHFEQVVLKGDWATLLSKYVSGLLLPKELRASLYELVLEEVVLLHGVPHAARALLQNAPALVALKVDAPARYMRLENMINTFDVVAFQDKAAKGDARVATPEMLKKREALLHTLRPAVTFSAAPYDGVLPAALSAALQDPSAHTGAVAPKRGRSEMEGGSTTGLQNWQDALLAYPIVAAKSIRSKLVYDGEQSVTHCVLRHPSSAEKDPQLLVGRTDGTLDFVEYKDNALTPLSTSVGHSSSVVRMTLEESDQSTWVAVGYRDGSVKLYNVDTHKLVRKFLAAHSLGITSIIFRGERHDGELQGHSPLLVTGAYDTHIGLLHIGSGTVLCKVKDAHHSTYINALCPLVGRLAGNCFLSGGNDGTLSLWCTSDETSIRRLGSPFTFHSLYAQLRDMVVTDLVALSSSTARNEVVAITRSEKVVVFALTVDEQNALSPMASAEVVALIVAPKAIRSGVAHVRPTAVQMVPDMCTYLTDVEGNILLYNVEMHWRSAEKRQQMNGVLKVTEPTDQSSVVIADSGSAVSDLHTVTLWTSASSPSVFAYGPSLAALYWLV
ncbi:WD40 repeat-containing protein SMU1 [Strigomonas culicis]|uniref:WD40 repeat-containing protein SMU1 n=1 Tax=Strigomonas culicis TaxID=28005 RepID=S9TUX1_9TRYP|nr:WD40 repeat-containing protein SMU1 [Strigomonas culicis]|eukprot:EPY20359.1 WD40 repeat-containing protein SMU1 [Strigomonas culicis]